MEYIFGLLKSIDGVEVWIGTGGDICDIPIPKTLPADEGMESVLVLGSSMELLMAGVVLWDDRMVASFVQV